MFLRFVIFTLARTGSTTLIKLLNCHPVIKSIFEPFNTANYSPISARADMLRHSHGIDPALQWVWQQCNGIKHVWHWNGWPFLDKPELNEKVLFAGTKLILLFRRNALQRAISVQVSDQMQLWTPNTAKDFERIRYHIYRPLDLAKLEEEVDGSRKADAWTRETVAKSGRPFLEVYYEDFFSPAIAMEERIERVQRVLEYLEVGRLADPERLARMNRLFDPATTGFQNAAAYERIPNIEEVEKKLGSAQNGFVFDRPRSAATEVV